VVSFIETPRFPDDIAYGSSGGPGWKTNVFIGQSGREQRTQVWEKLRGRYDVSYGIRDKAAMDAVRDFFIRCRGRATGFRFKDWGDYEIVNGNIGTGDGVTTVYPIFKRYGSSTTEYQRRIVKPIANTVAVRVNNVLQTLNTHYTLDANKGIITFDNTAIPASTHPVVVSCDFDIPARFDIDEMRSVHDGWQTESWGAIPIVELKPEEFLD
jgi:uncharacterized protein (TIGR02217 family)